MILKTMCMVEKVWNGIEEVYYEMTQYWKTDEMDDQDWINNS